MNLTRIRRYLALQLVFVAVCGASSRAEGPVATSSEPENWPDKVVVSVGELRTRIDGPKMWTLSGIDFQDTGMATEDSAYGTVLTIRNVGPLGTAHFLDVPGRPGQVEKEQVTNLELFVDEMPVHDFKPAMNLRGDSFRMVRKSKIRTIDLETSITIRDGVLIETASFEATGPIDLKVSYPWMYAFTAKATVYVFGDDDGIRKRGTFQSDGKVVSQVVQNMNWVAVFDPTSGKGSVCCFLRYPPAAEASFLLIDAPGVYRKVAAYSLVDKVVLEGFTGTYQSAVGFFNAEPQDWEEHALKRAQEIRSSQFER